MKFVHDMIYNNRHLTLNCMFTYWLNI